MELTTNTPYTFKEWANRQSIDVSDESYPSYLDYLKDWYKKRNLISSENKQSLKDEYIQLLKDLSFLFGSSEKNRFLNNIDYANEEEIIYSIPFFAKKLKEISKVLKNKRESIKNAKIKYNMIGSNEGLETLLYDYILRSFTKKEGNITQIPTSELTNFLPELSSVKDAFHIEIEELHDPNYYHDSDPSLDITNYVDIENLVGKIPYENLTEEELTNIIASRFIPRLANSSLSNLFQKYLEEDGINMTNVSTSLVDASRKFLGEPVYGLTAVRLSETNQPDQIINIDIKEGNNWFLWPSGNKVINDTQYSNIFKPIELNLSNFLSSGATGGIDYTSSDLIFTEKNGTVEGAWLMSDKISRSYDTMNLSVIGGEIREFIFPFCGFRLKTKGMLWDGFSLNERDFSKYNLLQTNQKEEILKNYYTQNLPNSASLDITLNRTSLATDGAYAGNLFINSDTIVKRLCALSSNKNFSDLDNGKNEAAFLYKFLKTDLPITNGVNYIYWPYMTYTEDQNIPITILKDSVLDIELKELDSDSFIGSTAGLTFDDSDVIFKLNSRTSEPIEAAFLQTSLTDNLDPTINSIAIYNQEATKCSKYISGAVQGSLSLKINPLGKTSFIWNDVDTYADEVFRFFDHSPDCPYIKDNDYYKDQNYINPQFSIEKESWKKCTCKSVYFSPIGHKGNTIFDYNGMADMLFHDPDGFGEDFSLNTWKDTRNLSIKSSPQFSFFKLDDSENKNVGWGKGSWKTGNGERMVLKTGKRYTFYRSSFRSDKNTSPYYVIKYPYKNINGICSPSNSDIVILWDISQTQTNVFESTKNIIKGLIKNFIGIENSPTQVSIIAFGNYSTVVGYLTKDYNSLNLFVNDVKIPTTYPEYVTNIKGALEFANYILTERIPSSNSDNTQFDRLCKNLNLSIIDGESSTRLTNNPRSDASKKIIIISDGKDSYDSEEILSYAEILKETVEIHAVDFGEWSIENNLMESIASSDNTYINLQKYLVYGDGNEKSFIEFYSRKINGCQPLVPRWMKAERDSNGNWYGTGVESDMVLRAGDFLSYIHRNEVLYSGEDSYSNFINNSIDFTINVKLNGWDYNSNQFSLSAYGDNCGAKPFWGKAYTLPDPSNRFSKETDISGGYIRFFNDYTPVSQPEVSDMVLSNGNFIKYYRRGLYPLYWNQFLEFQVTEKVNRWKKLEVSNQISNLSDILQNNNVDKYINGSDIDSDLILEGFSQFRPARYNYYSRSNFVYTQNLYYENRDENSFVSFSTGYYINPLQPYKNLTNVHYPTIAVTQFPDLCVTEKSVGYYMLPEKLGTSTYLGKGYKSVIDNNEITKIDSLSGERLFFDLEKYGNRNRGLTQKDQNTITKIVDIDNRWVSSSFFENNRSGINKNPQKFQKMTPYQTDYEIKGKNIFGISRQNDELQLWFPVNPAKWKDDNYKLTFKGELTIDTLLEKIQTFMVDKGILVQWKTDIYGNEFGLYKGSNNNLVTEDFIALLTEFYENIII